MPPARPGGAAGAVRARLAALLVALVSLGLVLAPSAAASGGVPAAGTTTTVASTHPTGGTLLLEDDFSGTSVGDPRYLVGGARDQENATWTPCLTAASAHAEGEEPAGPVPGCGLSAPDAPGAGALRLTPAENGVSGFVLYDQALPIRAGLDITFTSYQYGGDGADGISFFLADGDRPLTRPGGFGGALGYANRHDVPGVSGAILGVGLDAYGNWPLEPRNEDCTASGAFVPEAGTPPERYAQHVSVRGPGDGSAGYCLLDRPGPVPGLRSGTSDRPAPVVTRVVVDPESAASPEVVVEVDGQVVVRVPRPDVDARTFRFGWGSSTGGLTDVHEIGSLRVLSIEPLAPDLALDAAAPADPVASGEPARLVLTASPRSTGGPLPAGETARVVADLPAGASAGAPVGDGWDCAGTAPSRVDCTWRSTADVRPGAHLPPLVVPVTSTGSGSRRVAAVVTSTADGPAPEDPRASAVLRFAPGLAAVDLGEVDASSAERELTADLETDATGAVVVSVVGSPSPVGEVRPGTGAQVRATVTAGASGVLAATAAVVDGEGLRSPEAPVSLVVRPLAPPVRVSAASGEEVVAPPPSSPVGTGPFTYELLSPGDPGLIEEAVLDPGTGALRVRTAAGASGRTTLTYRVLDAGGTASAPAPVVVEVRPSAAGDEVRLALDAAGEGSVEVALPPPSGSGPFSYSLLVGADGPVTADLAPSTGVLAVTARTGSSGTARLRYAVEDADGVESEPVDVDVRVAPHVAGAEVVGAATDEVVRVPAPRTAGTGPFTYALVGETPGASVDPRTGEVALAPAGRSGRHELLLLATDAAGVTGGAAVVDVVVLPVARPVALRAVTSPEPPVLRATPEVVGAEDVALALVGGGDPAVAAVELDGDDVVARPAAGASGRVAASYTATADGLTSASAQVDVEVAPRSPDGAAAVVSGRRAVVPLPAPQGTGPFTHRLVDAPDPEVAVALEGDRAVVEVAQTFSGTAVVRYVVVDADGVESEPVELVLDVAPDGRRAPAPWSRAARRARRSPARRRRPPAQAPSPSSCSNPPTPRWARRRSTRRRACWCWTRRRAGAGSRRPGSPSRTPAAARAPPRRPSSSCARRRPTPPRSRRRAGRRSRSGSRRRPARGPSAGRCSPRCRPRRAPSTWTPSRGPSACTRPPAGPASWSTPSPSPTPPGSSATPPRGASRSRAGTSAAPTAPTRAVSPSTAPRTAESRTGRARGRRSPTRRGSAPSRRRRPSRTCRARGTRQWRVPRWARCCSARAGACDGGPPGRLVPLPVRQHDAVGRWSRASAGRPPTGSSWPGARTSPRARDASREERPVMAEVEAGPSGSATRDPSRLAELREQYVPSTTSGMAPCLSRLRPRPVQRPCAGRAVRTGQLGRERRGAGSIGR
ncbi:hypothetical protein WDV85_12090 [Pseudokineococcus sp. 5B2Z-1]|uniref:lectin-like domain-containing protein n=1 Tax=Pseudokineococcus sp. 5B2Z-1 TaxID=3132744 RepID=UPI0030B1B68B